MNHVFNEEVFPPKGRRMNLSSRKGQKTTTTREMIVIARDREMIIRKSCSSSPQGYSSQDKKIHKTNPSSSPKPATERVKLFFPGCGRYLADVHTIKTCNWILEKREGYNSEWESTAWLDSKAYRTRSDKSIVSTFCQSGR